MFKFKLFISLAIFSFLLILTSFVKNQTREIEKKIYSKYKTINIKEKDFNESQLDFYYLTSPFILEDKIKTYLNIEYSPLNHSKIFFDISDSFNDVKKTIFIDEGGHVHNEGNKIISQRIFHEIRKNSKFIKWDKYESLS